MAWHWSLGLCGGVEGDGPGRPGEPEAWATPTKRWINRGKKFYFILFRGEIVGIGMGFVFLRAGR